MKMNRFIVFFIIFLVISNSCFSQHTQDTVVVRKDSSLTIKGVDTSALIHKDAAVKKKHSPRKAAIRSAILPGWGQAYNRKYWKIPIVYGALGTTGAVFTFNIKQYRAIQYAYSALVNNDTAKFSKVEPWLQPFITNNATDRLFNARSEVRQNIDYSVLIFLFFWGLNVVDAVVDAHLKDFDVSPDISLKIKPGYNPTFNTTGVSLVFDIHKGKPRTLSLPN